jgi:diaminohydroxyphosphoribosylaminopyrimidine deaminase/5-amino-6-(5-phosphoribosylamino)uracil reductase
MPPPDAERWMRRALALAEKGKGTVSPNPMVGAVLVRGGKIVGEGWHERPGSRHAEAMALEAAGAEAAGAALYISLEPCNHHGKTPPCTEALVRAGVAEVWAATRDTNPAVKGGGIEALEKHGIRVERGLCEAEARKLNRAFFTWCEKGRPRVLLKWASSLDGRIAGAGGRSQRLTGEAARLRAHELRWESDAVLAGRGTAEKDDPLLTARLPDGREKPLLRVVLDGQLSLPPTLRIWKSVKEGPVLCATDDNAPTAPRKALEKMGVEIMRCPRSEKGFDLGVLLQKLAQRGVQQVLVEGGGRTAASFVEAGLADGLRVFLSPMLLGTEGRPSMDAAWSFEGAPRFRLESAERLGEDVFLSLEAEGGA